MVTETLSHTPKVIEAFVTGGGILLSGENCVDGSVLGRVTASGKLKLAVETAVDGSQTPFAILLEDCDASTADKNCPLLLSGIYNEDALVFGGTLDADGVRDSLRDSGIFLKTVVGA